MSMAPNPFLLPASFPALSGESKNVAGPRRDMYFITTARIFSTALEAWTRFLSTSHPAPE